MAGRCLPPLAAPKHTSNGSKLKVPYSVAVPS